MKTLELIKEKENVLVGNKTQEVEISSLDLLEVAINNPVKGGYSAKDMLTRIKLLDVVEATRKLETPTTITFEDEHFKALKEMVADTKWNVVSRTILKFCDEIEKL